MTKICETEHALAERKDMLETFQPEFIEAKKKFEEVCKKLEADVKEITELINERDAAYGEYVDRSGFKYGEVSSTTNKANRGGGFLDFFSRKTS